MVWLRNKQFWWKLLGKYSGIWISISYFFWTGLYPSYKPLRLLPAVRHVMLKYFREEHLCLSLAKYGGRRRLRQQTQFRADVAWELWDFVPGMKSLYIPTAFRHLKAEISTKFHPLTHLCWKAPPRREFHICTPLGTEKVFSIIYNKCITLNNAYRNST